jgi:GDP-L-fucose synthase
MRKHAKIYIAGHRGLVGSAIMRMLQAKGFDNLIVRTHAELDLTRQEDVEKFFEENRPEYVFLAAARVGGILANNTYKAQFIYENVMIAVNVIHAAYKFGVKKLLNLGSSCIYPKYASQPMKEEYLLTGPLEPTNEPYAIAKISAIKLCRYYNEQYGTNFISVMPTNLYGPNDNFHLLNSHVLPAFIRKFHLARLLMEENFDAIKKDFIRNGDNKVSVGNSTLIVDKKSTNKQVVELLKFYGISTSYLPNFPVSSVTLWGSGKPCREFLHVDDLARACVFLMQNYDARDVGEFVNIGTGEDIEIGVLAEIVRDIVGFKGEIEWDTSRPEGTPRKLLDVSRIRALGWEPEIGLREGIQQTYKWYRE